jgi:hypothetical protein
VLGGYLKRQAPPYRWAAAFITSISTILDRLSKLEIQRSLNGWQGVSRMDIRTLLRTTRSTSKVKPGVMCAPSEGVRADQAKTR